MSSTKIQEADYLRRMVDKKLDKVDPKLSFHARVQSAMKAMDEEFGPTWREVMDEADPMSPIKENPVSSPETEELFSNLYCAAEEEGLPPPPESMRKYGEQPKENKVPIQQPQQQPLVIVIQNRMKPNAGKIRSARG